MLRFVLISREVSAKGSLELIKLQIMIENEIEISDEGIKVEMIYPRVSERIKAAVADSILIIVFMGILTSIFSNIENVPDYARIIGFISIFVVYDPLFTSIFGGTIGHMIMNIRVKRNNNLEKNILFPLAIVRYCVKFLLGWVSLLSMAWSKKNLAIHDMLVGSIVLYKTSVTDTVIE